MKAESKMAGFCCRSILTISQRTKKAKEILERTGAQDVSSTGEASSEKGNNSVLREVA
jgi:hypothetical protein